MKSSMECNTKKWEEKEVRSKKSKGKGGEPEELPIVGEVGENNVITLTDDVPDDYTLCYLDEKETELNNQNFVFFHNSTPYLNKH